MALRSQSANNLGQALGSSPSAPLQRLLTFDLGPNGPTRQMELDATVCSLDSCPFGLGMDLTGSRQDKRSVPASLAD